MIARSKQAVRIRARTCLTLSRSKSPESRPCSRFLPCNFTSLGLPTLIARLLKRVALTLHARPDRDTNGRRPGDRGNDPSPGGGCVLEADRLSRGITALLKVGFVSFRCMIALDGRIVGATSARTKEQGGHDQRDMEQFHAPMIDPWSKLASSNMLRAVAVVACSQAADEARSRAGLRSAHVHQRIRAMRGRCPGALIKNSAPAVPTDGHSVSV
jgi:hypothetical protein